MTNPDYRAMCAELSDRLQRAITSSKADDFYHEDRDSIDRARALLAQPVVEEPTIPSSTLHRQELTPSEVTLLNTFWRSR
jgi:hypothetical protein